jgi:hypothetical protein
MKKHILTMLLFVTLSVFLISKEKNLFKINSCREAYMYHFLVNSCSSGDEIGVRILLSQEADPNGKGYKNYADCVAPFEFTSPLFVAISHNFYKIAKILLVAGANPNLLEGEGITPLVSATKNQNIAMIKLLLKYGAKIDMKGLLYKPLRIAKEKGNREIISLFEKN